MVLNSFSKTGFSVFVLFLFLIISNVKAQEKEQNQVKLPSTMLFLDYTVEKSNTAISHLSLGYSSYRHLPDDFISIFYDMNLTVPFSRTFYDFTFSIIPGLSVNLQRNFGLWLISDFGAGISVVHRIDDKDGATQAIAGLVRIGIGYKHFGISVSNKIFIGNGFSINYTNLGLVYKF